MDHLPTSLRPPATARDIMTTTIVQVAPDTTVREAARILLDSRIGAAPVVDAQGTLIGMLSEGDLLGRNDADRLSGQEWWLALLSKPGHADVAIPDVATGRLVREVMHAPVVTIEADASVAETATLLRMEGIKRLPVMRDGRMVGIVARADLLRVVEAIPGTEGAAHLLGGLREMLSGLWSGKPIPKAASAPPKAAIAEPATADTFRHLVQASVQGKADERKAAVHAADLARMGQVKTMLHQHIGEEMWNALLTHARVTAAHGGNEIQMLRFPAGLCSDSGRKLNNADPGWTETLRGEAAELYARYERELKPVGFGMEARVADYPNGMPGDVALFLVWQA